MSDQTWTCQMLAITLHVAHQATADQDASMHMRMVCVETTAVHNSQIKQSCIMGFAKPEWAD